jgi:hypothetical protein
MTDQQPLLNQPAPNWSQAPAPWVQQPQPTFQQYPPAQQYPPQYAPPGQWAGYPPAAQYPPYQPPYAPRYLPPTDQRTNSVEVTFAWILTVLTVLYFLPWAIAATRGKSNSGAIAVLNFLLGCRVSYGLQRASACWCGQCGRRATRQLLPLATQGW